MSSSSFSEDRISALPDEILSHILSFLPIKLAFTTTILSKGWNKLSYSLSVLDFHSQYLKNYETFQRFVRFTDNLILSHLSPIKTFSLSIHYDNLLGRDDDYSHIFNSWLEAAIRRRVQEFHLNLNFNGFLNPNLFTSTTLVFLKLEKLIIATDTSCVHLPSLKTLYLIIVLFKNYDDFIHFYSTSPNLEVLHLDLVSSCPINERDIHSWPQGERRHVKDELQTKVSYISETVKEKKDIHWDGIVELLQHCPKLQIFFIHKSWNSRSTKQWKFPISVLECVSSHLRSCTILNYTGSTNDLRFASYILQNGSLLQDMLVGFPSRNESRKRRIIEKLSSCPKISPTCNLFIDDY